MNGETQPTVAFGEADLNTCAREPIHIPASIQPDGCVLAFGLPGWRLERYSANLAQWLPGMRPRFGLSPDECMGQAAADRLRALSHGLEEGRPRILTNVTLRGGVRCDCVVQRAGSAIVVECEPVACAEKTAALVEGLRAVHEQLHDPADVLSLLRHAIPEMRRIFGYDRAMVYHFAPDWSGKVIVEDRREGLESFLGQHFPSTDIPPQARELYCRSLIRVIGDATFQRVPLHEEAGLPALDMSFMHLRAVSPVHCEYLGNMGVRASMSISLVVDGQLWGLIAFHHYAPRRLPLPARATARMLGEFVALQIIALVRTRRLGLLNSAHGFLSSFLRDAPRVSDISGYFRDRTPELLDIIECDGGGVWIDGSWTARGEGVPPAALAEILRVADARADGQIWYTDRLSHDCPGLGADTHGMAGAMVIPIWPARRDYLVLLRRELVRTLMWGGDPEKTYPSGRLGERLSPRSSFEVWKQDVRGRSAVWSADDVELATQMRTTLLEVMAAAHQQKLREQEQTEATQRMLNDELNHRVKNILAVMQALVTRAPAEGDSITGYSTALRGRIRALSSAHDQALRMDHGATLHDLLAGELAPYASQPGRIMLEGTCLRFGARALTFMALLFHELATNAAKYGALSVPTGAVSVAWEWTGQECHICWCERGGPPVTPPARSGFGGLLIERAIVHDLKGRAERRFLPHGVVVDVTLPGSTVVNAPRAERETAQVAPPPDRRPDGAAPALAGCTVMVLEDEFLVALDMEDMLLAQGVAQVHLVASVEEALALLAAHRVDVALLDVNVAGVTSAPVARTLQASGTPFIFSTGYGGQAPLAAEFPQAHYLEKPVSTRHLLRLVSRMLDHGGAGHPD